MRFRLDSMVQIVLQQGQVEVEAGDFIADYTNALLIHRKVIEDLNSTIRVHRIIHLSLHFNFAHTINHYGLTHNHCASILILLIVSVHQPETKHKTKSGQSSLMAVCTRNK